MAREDGVRNEVTGTADGGDVTARSRSEPVLSVVVPTFNESGNVEELLRRLADAVPHDGSVEVVFVDDSTDDTPAVIAAAAEVSPLAVGLVHREVATGGLGGAVVEGLRRASGPWVVVMDGDLQHPPSLVPVLHRAGVSAGADLVVATRYTEEGSREGLGSFYRRTVSSVCTELAGLVLGDVVSRISDPLSGFFAVRKEALRLEEARPLGYKILLDLIVRNDLRRIEQVPYRFGHRFTGESKSSFEEGLRYGAHLARLRYSQGWRRPRVVEPRPSVPAQRTSSEPAGLRVLVVTSEAPPIVSGVSRCVDRLTVGLRERGHQVEVVSAVQIPRFTVGEWRFSLTALYWPMVLRRIREADVVNLHGPIPTMSDVFLVMWRLFTKRRAPVVYTHHSALEIRGLEKICAVYNRLHRVLSMSARMTLTTSSHYADLHAVPDGPPTRIAPWGVDLRPTPDRDERDGGPLRVLFVGQMRSYKGVEWLLEAVAGRPELELTLIGAGTNLAEYQALAERLDATNVRFLGRVPDAELHAAYDHHDVVVLPSVTQAEAFGLVVLEGMAAGCVPVVSDLPGVRDLAAEAGVIVPPRDADAIRRALLSLADDPARLRELRRAARAKAETLTWDTCVDTYERALYEALGRTPPALPDPGEVVLLHRPRPWRSRVRVRRAAFTGGPPRPAARIPASVGEAS